MECEVNDAIIKGEKTIYWKYMDEKNDTGSKN